MASRKKKGPRGRSLAQQADRHALYEEAVQEPAGDVAVVRRLFRKHYGRDPRLLREDFCGTAAMACAWVAAHRENRAFGVDFDPDPLGWGLRHNVAALSDQQARRIKLLEGDVREVSHGRVDVTVAFNFSYFVFQSRLELVNYFRKARSTLRRQGLFVLDLYGGPESQRTLTETREHDHFDYVWDQDVFDPIQQHAVNHIHFEFPDGSRLQRAFTYDWRLWSIPELREALEEAGFRSTQAYWERTDSESEEGSGIYYPTESAADDPAWVTYLSALP